MSQDAGQVEGKAQTGAADADGEGEPRADGPLIALRDVSKAFGALRVLQGVSLDVTEGETLVVIGPSGTGKSVTLKLIVGLLKPDRGEVLFEGRRVDRMTDAELAGVRTQLGFLFQMAALFDSMTVEQNVCFPLTEHTRMSRAEQRERCAEVLKLLGIDGLQGKWPADLSGGQRKRVGLARAIALRPRVVLYDEPTTGLDPVRADAINELVLRLRHELGVTSIVVTHDMTSAYKIADRITMLYDGRLIAEGTPDAIREAEDPVVRRFVRGEADPDELPSLPHTGDTADRPS